MKKMVVSGVIAGIIMFAWSAFSWMVLPWHMETIHQFKNEQAVSEVLKASAPVSGIYLMPMMDMQNEASVKAAANMPQVFASVHLEGMNPSMTMPMIIALVTQIILGFLVAGLLCMTGREHGYFCRLGFVIVFALAAAIMADAPMWNWFKFDTHYTMVVFADQMISWFLAGLVLAKVCKRKSEFH